jgi:vitamin B12 transporter
MLFGFILRHSWRLRVRLLKTCLPQWHTFLLASFCLISPWAAAFDNESTTDMRTDTDADTMSDVIVTSTKIDIPAQFSTQSVTIITEDQIKDGNFSDTTEVLRQLGGIQFKKAGAPGQFNYPKARGLPTAYFLVVVDGVKINEGMSSGVGNFIGQINPKLIERIEILRGPEADLYGADSVAGVISITTKGALSGTHAELGAEYGSLNWKQGYGGFRGTKGDFGYSVNLAYIDSDGVHDYESYRNFSPQMKIDYHKGDWLSIEGSVLYMDTNFNYADLHESYAFDSPETPWWAFQLPDPNQYSEAQQTIGSLNFKNKITDNLRQKALLGWSRKKTSSNDIDNGLLGYVSAPTNDFTLDYVNDYDQGEMVPVYDDGDGTPYYYQNENFQFDYNLLLDSKVAETGKNTVLFGYEYFRQEGKKWGKYGDLDAENFSNAFYVNDVLTLLDDAVVLRVGLRNNQDDQYGSHTTGKIGASYTFKDFNTTLYANYGTSFKAPSFSQLFDPKYGNPDVQPEEGRTIEAGLRQAFLGKRLNFELTYWRTQLDDIIAFIGQVNSDGSYGGTYVNRDKGQSQGVELVGNFWINENWSLNGNYTYTDSWSEEDGVRYRTVQVAYNTANLGVMYQQPDFYTLGANFYYSGPRLRWNGDKEMEAYTRVDVYGRVHLDKNLLLYGRIDNLFNTEIVEGLGYEQPGIYALAGLEWKM